MRFLTKSLVAAIAVASLWLVGSSPDDSFMKALVPDAGAIVGRPLSPVSYAGVARRTTRRVVYAEGASAEAAQQQAAAAPQQAAAPQASSENRLPSGTVVTALPSGCQSTNVDGVSLFNCGGVMYQPTFQSNNLVYVVK